MSDLISREEMISQLEYCLANFTDYKKALEETLRKVKGTRRVEPQEWISVKDRLPELGQMVLVTYADGDVETNERMTLKNLEVWKYGGNVVAWMPLPSPYKGE